MINITAGLFIDNTGIKEINNQTKRDTGNMSPSPRGGRFRGVSLGS
jgi:hypothetical protein